MNFVDLDRVSLRYGEDGDGTLALHGATLRVTSGEFVAVVGPSGCGKSTLMKVVTGLWPPSAGSVIVSGREVTAPLSIVGMAFQNPTLLPWRTTLDNVMLPLEIVQPHCSRLRRERAAYVAKARALLALVGQGLRGALSLAAVRRHAAAHIAMPRADPRSHSAHAGRAVRRTRHVYP
jgi:NitT/TauT family transport system ATP-binding protein